MEQATIKKNILDLRYNKSLQFFTTTIITLVTYFIAIAITLFTQKIEMTLHATIPFLIVSIIFTAITGTILSKLYHDLRNIDQEIKNLT